MEQKKRREDLERKNELGNRERKRVVGEIKNRPTAKKIERKDEGQEKKEEREREEGVCVWPVDVGLFSLCLNTPLKDTNTHAHTYTLIGVPMSVKSQCGQICNLVQWLR